MKRIRNVVKGSKKRLGIAVCIGVMLSVACAFSAEAKQEKEKRPDSGWRLSYTDSGATEKDGNREPYSFWRHFGVDGILDTGWKLIDGWWYFLSTEENGNRGRMLTGWQWIDGKCYYLSVNASKTCPEGAMWVNGSTPDGYSVGPNGAWLMEDGTEWHVPGKGIPSTRRESVIEPVKSRKSGGSGKGGSSGGGGNHGFAGGNQGGGNQGGNSTIPIPKPSDNESGTGQELPSLPPPITPPLSPDHGEQTATPSAAKRVRWEVRFVDEKDKNSEILPRQQGVSEEGTELSIDFPETIHLYGQQYLAKEQSPVRLVVEGQGIQKYEIVFREMETSSGGVQQAEEHDGIKRLSDWHSIALKADSLITGQPVEGWSVITDNQQESEERMKNLISMVHDVKRHEIYLLSKNHNPSTVVISQEFPDVSGVSELLMDEFDLSGAHYRIVRIGFQRTWDTAGCTHEFRCTDHVAAACLSGGHDTYRCLRCGFWETFFLPPTGHSDEDGDGLCDVCDMSIHGNEGLEEVHFQLGDIQIRNVAGKSYRFRCIDEDYRDGTNGCESAALFLCDTVIRPDQEGGWGACGSTGFGSTNNYKTSYVRKWIRDRMDASDCGLIYSFTGVNTAFQGATASSEYEQFSFDELQSYEKPFQRMEDQMFLLSLEEAIQYRDVLWRFNGSPENNPETQYSYGSRGYFLRTPQYEGQAGFEYGKSIYAVDLADGSLHPVPVSDTGMGIRPAITVRQS